MRIKAAIEADHQGGTSFIHHIKTGAHPRRSKVDGLFTEDGLAGTRELFDLLRM